MQFFPIFCSLSLIFVFFPHFLHISLCFFWKYPNFGLKFSGSFRILKTTHKTGPWKDKDFSKKYTPMWWGRGWSELIQRSWGGILCVWCLHQCTGHEDNINIAVNQSMVTLRWTLDWIGIFCPKQINWSLLSRNF